VEGPKGRDQWEDLDVGGRITIKMDLKGIGIDGANWIRLAQDRVQWRAFVDIVMNLRVLQESRLFFTSWVTISFANYVLHHAVSE
jgi:hypothetical protein